MIRYYIGLGGPCLTSHCWRYEQHMRPKGHCRCPEKEIVDKRTHRDTCVSLCLQLIMEFASWWLQASWGSNTHTSWFVARQSSTKEKNLHCSVKDYVLFSLSRPCPWWRLWLEDFVYHIDRNGFILATSWAQVRYL